MGRHRKPSRVAINVVRIAVGGIALAEITGGLPAIPANAAPVETPVVLAAHSEHLHHGHHHKNHNKPKHHAVKHAAKAPVVANVAAVTPTVAPAAAVVAPVVADPAAYNFLNPDPGMFTYTVRPGDTLTHIAAAFGLSYEAIWAVNADTVIHPDDIFPGQVLRIPS